MKETMQDSLPSWLILVDWVEKGVLGLLIFLSIWSVSIMIYRYRWFKGLRETNFEAVKGHLKQGNLAAAQKDAGNSTHPASQALMACLLPVESTELQVERAFRSHLTENRGRWEEGLSILATLGSNAPFIGLFGTVLGIIKAFGALSATSGQSQSVMSSISFALVATAMGLVVAIPAVVSYNVFSKKVRELTQECEILRDLYLAYCRPGSHGIRR